MSYEKQLKKFDKRVKWEFSLKLVGRGKNVLEAIKDALEYELNNIDDYDIDTLYGIEQDEVLDIDEADFEQDEALDEAH